MAQMANTSHRNRFIEIVRWLIFHYSSVFNTNTLRVEDPKISHICDLVNGSPFFKL